MRSSIRFKIISLTVIPIALIYLLIFGFGVYQLQLHLHSDVEREIKRLTQHYAGIFTGFMNESAQIARSTAAIIEQNPNIPEHELYALVKSNLRHNRIVYGSAIAFDRDPEYDNELFAPYAYRTSGRVQTLDIADVTDYTAGGWQWWEKVKTSRYPAWTDPYFDKGVGDIVMATYAVPFFYKKEFKGVATIDLQLEILEETVNQGIDADLDLLIVTGKGEYVYHPDPGQIMANSIYKDAETYQQEEIKILADKMTSGERGVFQLSSWETNQPQWVSYYPILNTNWSIALRVPEKIVLAQVRKRGVQFAFVLLFSLLLIVVTVWLVIGKITQPLARLTAGVKSVAAGNLDAAVEVTSNDEIGLLAENFTDMASKLSKREFDIREARSQGFSRIVQGLKGRYFYFTHDKKGQISYVSPSVYDTLGYTSDEFQNLFKNYFIESPLNKEASKKIQLSFNGEQQEAFELELVSSTNELLRFEVIEVPVKGENGEIVALEGMAHDITERVREEEKFRVLFESSSQASLLCSEEGLLDCNNAFLGLFGFHSKDDVLGLCLYSFAQAIQPDGKPALDKLNALMKQTVEVGYQQQEFVFERVGGVAFHAEITLTAATMNDQAVFIGLIQDLTERKLTEQEIINAKEAAEEANKTKGEFLSNMSHELRTPLNGVLGYAQILQNDQHVTDDQMESLDAIKSCGHHLLTLINDVLDLSKVESGNMEFNITVVDLPELIKGVYDMILHRVTAKGIKLDLMIQDGLPRGIKTDATKLRQVLINLLGNAVKFTHSGTIALHVLEDCEKTEPDSIDSEHRVQLTHNAEQRSICFIVADTGIGVPEEKQQSIFDAFKQAKEGMDAGGTGLGLAISQRLIQEMGGTKINLESSYGEGSAFSFSLPLIEVSDEDLPLSQSNIFDDSLIPVLNKNEKVTALIVDDRQINRDILKRLLLASGFDVMEASNGEEAIDITLRYKIPLILMDIRMPGVDGASAAQTIRKRISEGSDDWDVVIIAVTAGVFPKQEKQVTESGMDDFISKPFRIAELFNKIEQHTKLKFDREKHHPELKALSFKPSSEKVSKLSLSEKLECLEKIQVASEMGDVGQIKLLFSDISPGDILTQDIYEKLKQMIKEFDFDGIQMAIKVILTQHAKTGKTNDSE
ncbi:MAG: response regulator [Gammaproteobacteria bacterium]|nr:response regulator [Gammaproteobacteria bacterium]